MSAGVRWRLELSEQRLIWGTIKEKGALCAHLLVACEWPYSKRQLDNVYSQHLLDQSWLRQHIGQAEKDMAGRIPMGFYWLFTNSLPRKWVKVDYRDENVFGKIKQHGCKNERILDGWIYMVEGCKPLRLQLEIWIRNCRG